MHELDGQLYFCNTEDYLLPETSIHTDRIKVIYSGEIWKNIIKFVIRFING